GVLISFGMPLAALQRREYGAFFRRSLETMAPEDAARVLAPLQHDAGEDTRALATSLLRDLGLGKEIVPAAPREGHGNEASPAARGRGRRAESARDEPAGREGAGFTRLRRPRSRKMPAARGSPLARRAASVSALPGPRRQATPHEL